MISGIVREPPLPRELIECVQATIGCLGGACLGRYLAGIEPERAHERADAVTGLQVRALE